MIPPPAGLRHSMGQQRLKAKRSLPRELVHGCSDRPSSHHLSLARRALGVAHRCLRRLQEVVGSASQQVVG